MISRVAEHCFWFGRYLERVESTARVLFVTRNLALDSDVPQSELWGPVLTVAGELPVFTARHGAGAERDGEVVQAYMTWSEDNACSLRRSVAFARENARSIREQISLETWEIVNELYLFLESDTARAQYADARYEFYRRVRNAVQLALGLLRSTMLHDTPLDFIWLGMLLERTGQTARILDVHHEVTGDGRYHPETEVALWLGLLRACSGFEPFMKRNQGRVTGSAVAGFLAFETAFPRSVRYCLRAAYERLCAIRPPEAHLLPGVEAVAQLGALDHWLAERATVPLDDAAVHAMLTRVIDETDAVCEAIGRELLGRTPVTDVQSAAQ